MNKSLSKNNFLKRGLFLIFTFITSFSALSQDGPGGVNTTDGTSDLVMWFIADSATVSGNEVTYWENEVDLHDMDMEPVGTDNPTLVTSALNGHSEVSWANVNDKLYSVANIDASTFPSDEATVIMITRHDNNSQQSMTYVAYGTGVQFGNHNPWNGTVIVDMGDTGANEGRFSIAYEDEWVGNYGIWTYRLDPTYGRSMYRDNDLVFDSNSSAGENNGTSTFTPNTGTKFRMGELNVDEFQGDIAEFIVFKDGLNDAELTIVNNYLAAKYDLNIIDDFYLFQASHGIDVIGIGQNGSDIKTEAKSANIFTIKDASSIDTDGDYIFAGHDNENATSWTTDEQINGNTNLERIAREWRFDTSGDPGTITISIDATNLPAFNTNFGFYTLWIDDDGDFTTGATQYTLTQNGSEFEATGITVADGMFATISAYNPEINFAQTTFSGKEDAGDAVFEINIDYPVDADITVNYTISGTCTEDLPIAGTFTIITGSTSTTLNVPITSGDAFESDETIILTLTDASQSHGSLGSFATSTYTVNDDGVNSSNTIQYDAPFSYSHKKTLTISKDMVNGSSDLEDFPVMIRIDGTDLTEIEANLQDLTNAYDLRFTYANSLEWLEHQIEVYTNGSEYVAWIKLPTLSSSTDTEIDVYYGNTLVTTDPSVNTVFGNDYEAVYHLENINDNSGNSNTGALNGNAAIASGYLGNGLSLDGSGDYLEVSSSASLTLDVSNKITLSTWYKGTDTQGELLARMDAAGGIHKGYSLRIFSGELSLLLIDDWTNSNQGIRVSSSSSSVATDDDWHYLVATYDGSATSTGVTIYIDGEATSTNMTQLVDNLSLGDDIDSGLPFNLGRRYNTTGNDLSGLLDESRVIRNILSSDWIKTEYNNMSDAGTLVTMGTSVATSGFQVTESTDSVNLTIAIASVDGNDVSIDYAVTSGSASSGSDYTLIAGTATITAGNLSTIVTVDLSDDSVDELDETLTVTLSNPVSLSDVSLGTNDEIEITLLDDDDGPTISVSDISLYINEGSSINKWYVNLTQASEQSVTVDYTVTAISATSGVDYIHNSGTLTVPVDSTSASVSFNVIDDEDIESIESFTIQLSNPINATLDGVLNEITVFINDNDNFGIDGPGGVGDADGSGTLVMWMIADSVTNTGHDTPATAWENEIDIPSLDLAPDNAVPTYKENIANGHASVSFSSAANDRMMSSTLSVATFPYNEASVFVVTTHDNQEQQSLLYATRNGPSRFNAHIPWNERAFFDIGGTAARVRFDYEDDWVGAPSLLTSIVNGNTGTVVHRNGTQVGSDSDVGFVTDHTSGIFGLGVKSIDNFAGDIMEFIMYTSPVNDAQRIITENYLAAKYDLVLTNDYYAFETTHSTELVGIGQEDSDNFHNAAESGLLTISNASTLDDGDYIFIGHDNLDISAWTTTDVPSDLSNIQRVEREYRVDIEGAPGTISVAIDESQLPSLPIDYTEYVLITDADGVFNDDAILYAMSLVDGEYIANNVVVESGTYFTIATHRRTLEFVGNSFQDFENVNNTISLSLSLASGSDVSISYTITGTATNSADYSIATSGSFTISAGNTIEIIDLGILDESDEETDETIMVTLGTAPTGTVLGTNTEFTYTINDDDNDRSIIIDHFSSYRDITINSAEVTGNHTDFPVLLSFTGDADFSNVAGSMTNVNGYDIAFYDSLNSVWLDHDLEYYNDNGATADLSVWLKIPSLTSSADVNITMFYGNSGITFDQSSNETWMSSYQAVWHMGNDDYSDHTSNGTNGVDQGADDAAGVIGRAAFFDGSSNVKVSDISNLNFGVSDSYTISAWYKGTDDSKTIAGLVDDNSNGQGYDLYISNSDYLIGWQGDDTGSKNYIRGSAGGDVNDDLWHYVVITYDGSSGIAYKDGTNAMGSQNSTLTGTLSPNVSFTIGSRSSGAAIARAITGTIDEVRVVNQVLSPDWIATEYNNVTNSGSFMTVGSHTVTDNLNVLEDFGTVTVSVRVDPIDATQATTVNFDDATTGSAIIDSDFTLTPGTINVLAGESTGTFTFDIINDLTDEIDETIDVQISNPSSNAKLGTVTSQTYTVTDDDNGSTIDFIDAESVANEGSSLTSVILQIDVESGQDISVDYAVTGGDATSGTDYIALSGTATIPAGDLTETISFQPIDDPNIEAPETVEITISNPLNGTLGTNTIHTITIADNDDLGFEGPGGVGDVENALGENLLKLWLIADSVVSSGGSVTSWNNTIQNVSVDYDMVPATGTAPDVVDAAINGHKEISFNNVSDALVSEGGLTAASFPGNELSMFIVTETDNLNQASYAYATGDSEAGLIDANSISASIPNASSQVEFDLDGDNFTDTYDIAWAGTHSIFTHIVSSDTFMVYRNNDLLINRDDTNATFTGHTDYNLYIGKDGTDFFQGDIAEVIMFSRDVNAAQSNLINNYLAAKYNLSITNDYYNFEVSHGVEVAGIGQFDDENQHVAARAGIVTISNASDLDDNEYVLFGHDNGDISTWVSSEVPTTDISRTAREWRFDNTGSPGSISIAISSDLLPALPDGDEDYVILQDTDGDFSSGATVINTVLVDGQYKASDLTITSGDYVTFAIATRTVSFALTTDNGPENLAANATISLSLESSSDITLDYTITDGTATGGSVDYSLVSSGTITFLAGQTSVDLSLGLINDFISESDETIEITLSNPPAGVSLSSEVFTYTINDDDNSRAIQFDATSATVNEDAGTISLNIVLEDIATIDPINPTTVDVTVTGGTAESSPSPDYTFVAGTATIAATESSVTFDFDIIDDVLSESDETIEISLSSPNNANLGTNSVYTYTITDNDVDATVAFQETTTSIDEGGSIAAVFVELSTPSGQDVNINYAITGGDAIGGGVDYTLASGTLTIATGDQLGTINIALTDDGIEESGETIEITLSGAVGAILGSQAVHTVSIVDNDSEFGYYGPGGVGDAESNMLWLDATAINGKGLTNLSDASSVTTWVDRSGNENDFTAIGAAPVFDTDALNLKNTVIISSSAQGLQAPAGFSNALSNYSFMSVLSQTSGDYLAETNTAATSEFRLSQSTIGLYSINDSHRLANTSSTSEDVTTWIFNSANSPTSAEIFRNGSSLTSDDNFQIMSISNNFALGSRNSDQTQATSDFEGNISEFIIYNKVINAAQRIIIENYLANKYDLTIANDLYSYEGTYGQDIVGIGQTNGEQHLQSMSDSLMMISGASDLDNDEYVFAGHDGGDDLAWTTSEVPSDDINIQRLAREWRVDITGTPGTLIIKIDTTQMPSPASGYNEYLVWTDDDGDFRSGSTTYQVEYSEVFGFHVSDEIIISDGTFIAIGIAQPVVEFALATSDSNESDTNPSLEVSLNFTLGEDVTVDYAATGGSATGSNVDYLLTSGTLIITAGQMSANISLGIIDDSDIESDETIEITLSTPSSNVSLGATSAHTYTIHDNDNTRNIQYSTPVTETGDEAVSIYTVTIEIDVQDVSNPTTIDISPVLTGDYATEGVDYTLSTTTVSVPANSSTATFDITIIDDGDFENDETITLNLTNPTNSQLGTNDQFVYTITDNDTAPVASFSDANSFVNESGGTAQIEVTLDAISVNDVTVNYTVSATATSGADYTLDNGSLLISAGDISENIQPIIVNDLITESAETITITLTTATNATVSGTIVHVLTINDDDQAGSTGPGGVGDNTSNMLWLTGDNFSTGTWSDISGNSNDFSAGITPSTGTDINGNNTVAFTGTEYLETTSISSVAGDYDAFFLLNASDLGDQVLFGSNDTDDISLGYNNSQGIFEDVNGWTGTEQTTTGTNIVHFNLESGSNMAEYFINGTSISSATYTATSIGGTQSVGALPGGSEFLNGDMGEVIIYSTLLNSAQQIIVENYLSSKYSTATANDLYAYDDGTTGNEYQSDLIGIGQVDSDNIHVTATSENFMTIANPNSLDDGEYLMIANDDGATLNWTDNTNTPNATAIQRLDKEWRVDMTGNLGTISFQIDTTALPAPPSDGLTWALLVESADGDFTNGDTQIYPLSFVSGDIMGLDGVSFIDGDYFTIAVVSYETIASGNFEDAGTWSTGVVPTTGVSATITSFIVTMNTDAVIGSLIIEDTGILDLNGNTIEFSDGCITLEGTGSVTIATAGSTVGYANPDIVDQCITPMTYNNIYTDGPSGSTKYLLGDITILGDITLQSSGGAGAIFDVQDIEGTMTDFDIIVGGNWSNEITFNSRTGSVTFNGTSDQDLSNSIAGGETFNDLIVNNTGGDINFGSDISTSGILTMTNGNVVLGGNDLTIDNSTASSIIGGGSSSYIVATSSGLLRQSVALSTPYSFPVGDAIFYSPFTFVLNSGTLGSSPSITLNLRDDTYAGITEPTYISRYWTLEETDITGSFGYDVSYIYDDSDVIGTESSLLATKYENTSTYIQGGTADASTNTVTSDEYDSFSVHTAQSFVNPLPVELLSFGGVVFDGRVDLHWSTASEIDNDYFLIERSTDLEVFEVIGEVAGNGTINQQIDYTFTDQTPYYGISYYRLVQVDFDGKMTEYNEISINNDKFLQGLDMTLFPNPASSNEVTLRLTSGDENSKINVSIYSMTGRIVYHDTFDARLGTQDISLEIKSDLKSGIYHVKVEQANNLKVERLMIK